MATNKEDTQRVLRIADLAQTPIEMLASIAGYEDMPIVLLENCC